jgi:glutaminyl-peptide cyclotransferase
MRFVRPRLVFGLALAVVLVLSTLVLLGGSKIAACLPANAACGPSLAGSRAGGEAGPLDGQPTDGPLAPGQVLTPNAYLPALTKPSRTPAAPITYTYQIINTYPHDTGAFTEGLLWHDGFLYESTGIEGHSGVRRVDLTSGQVLQRQTLNSKYFGEGISIVGDRLYQLTWQSHTGFIYDKNTFAPLSQFSYPTEGWGMTYDGQRLIMSDGSAKLYFLDPDTLARTGQITVTDRGLPITNLNELEFIQGQIYANIWHEDRIAIIEPGSGHVTAWLDLTGLRPPDTYNNAEAVLNGIAYDPATERLFVTGKLWPSLFEIKLKVEG